MLEYYRKPRNITKHTESLGMSGVIIHLHTF